MFTRAASIVLPCAFILLSSVSLLAQSPTTGRIAGTVRDPNSAVIVGAEVTISSNATGEKRIAITDKEGNYAVPLLPPIMYRVSVTANGFATRVLCLSISSIRMPARFILGQTTLHRVQAGRRARRAAPR